MSTLSLRGAPRLKTYDLPGVIVLACVVMVVGALANGVGCHNSKATGDQVSGDQVESGAKTGPQDAGKDAHR